MVPSMLALVTLLSAIASPQGPDWSNPRALPSLAPRWKVDVTPCAITEQGGAVFILAKDRLLAHNVATGALLWEQKSVAGQCPFSWQEPLRVIGDVVVAAVGEHLFLVERETGRILHTVALGERMIRLAGPPLVVEVMKGQGSSPRTYELLSVDSKTGQVVARLALKDSLTDLDIFGQVAVVVAASGTGGQSAYDVTGLALPGLKELWRTTGRFHGAELIGGAWYLLYEDWARSHILGFYPLDPRTGRQGTPLPARASPNSNNDYGIRLPFELELVASNSGKLLLRRNGVPDARSLWTTELPGVLTAWVRDGDRLYVHCSPKGRGMFMVIDWATGAVREAAYGLRSVYQVATSGGLVILAGEEGVVAVSGQAFGPPEAATRPVADEVGRILSRPMEFWNLGDPMKDLQALGPEALPSIVSQIPGLEGFPLRVAAWVLGEGGYRPAAAPLAARLRGVYANDKDPRQAILLALSRIGGAGEVEAVAASLTDRRNPAGLRRQALATLASIGTPEAAAAIDRFLAQETPEPPWWDPRTWWDAMHRPARTEEQETVAAISEQFFLFGSAGDPTKIKLTVRPAEPGTESPAGREERVYQLLLDDPDSPHADRYQVVVRKLGRRWVIREISEAMRVYRGPTAVR